MGLPVKPIKPQKISDQVAEQLTELIFRGFIKPGERFPSERELAKEFKVSRPTIREAVSHLCVKGLLEQRQGQGTFVKPLDQISQNPLSIFFEGENINLQHILEVRLGLECNAAAFAALRADESDLMHLKTSLETMKQDIAQGGLGHEADISFHMAIAYSTKNPVQVKVMRSMYNFLFFGIKMNLQKLYEIPENVDKIMQQHTEIYLAIRHRDTQASLEAMKKHITFVLDFFKKQSELQLSTTL